MTQLYFRYSYIYEKLLSKITGQEFTSNDFKLGQEFVGRYTSYWSAYNDKVFEFYKSYGFEMADFWIAYFVKSKKDMTPFSDPMTLFINEDFEELTSITVHELCHVLQVYPDNETITAKLYEHIQKVYPENGFDLNAEIVTVILTRPCLIHLYGKEKADKLLEMEKDLPVLGKAWVIIDAQPEVLAETNPVEAVLKLKKA